ncbi:MAG: transglycosylase family protein [Actinomycetota bacterium]
MERLMFGRRARRRAGLQRVAIGVWIASMAGTLIGVPTGMELLGRMAAGGAGGRRLETSETVGPPPTGMDLLGRMVRGEAQTRGVETSQSAASLLRFRQRMFDLRARPKPPQPQRKATDRAEQGEQPEPAPTPTSVSGIVLAAAAEFDLSGEYLLSVATCESGLDPDAHNAVGYYGLFQFDQETWAAYGYGSIYDPVAQSHTAARLLAAGDSQRWPNCA